MVGVDSAVPPAAWTHYIKIPESMQLTATTERGKKQNRHFAGNDEQGPKRKTRTFAIVSCALIIGLDDCLPTTFCLWAYLLTLEQEEEG